MKKKTIKIVFCLTALLSSMNVLAAAHQWTGWYPIKEVYSYWDGSFFIQLDPSSAAPNPAECNSEGWLRVMPDVPNAKEMYQMSLTAQAAGLKVNAMVSGTECNVNHIKIYHLRTLNN